MIASGRVFALRSTTRFDHLPIIPELVPPIFTIERPENVFVIEQDVRPAEKKREK